MGSNYLWTMAESQIVSIYDNGLMTLDTLDAICNAYAGTDIDSGGSRDLETKDGKSMEQVAVELVNPDFAPNENKDDPWGWHEEFGEISRLRWDWR